MVRLCFRGQSRKIKKTFAIKIIDFVIITVGFVSGVMAIIMCWSEF